MSASRKPSCGCRPTPTPPAGASARWETMWWPDGSASTSAPDLRARPRLPCRRACVGRGYEGYDWPMAPTREERLVQTLVELADTLVDDFDVIAFLHMLTARATE